jgi:crotonobetainyl-CoA:carnitine CoA-transferase CaiB-like acyl-CoA transferase
MHRHVERALPADRPTRPLDGVTVVSVEQAVAGPLCTLRLGDAGARVIKIEAPGGDRARYYDEAMGGTSVCFAWLNRGKESAELNLKSDADLALVKRMIARADVFVQNLAPGASARLGLGAAELTASNPRLIVVDIMGYGSGTPYAKRRAYDMLVQAESGICAVTGTPDTPSKVGISIADIGTGTHAYAAVLEALIERQATGRGRAIEISMFDGMAEWMSIPLLHYEYMGMEAGRHGLSHASVYPYRPYDCMDGSIVISVQSTAEWTRFCRDVLQRPEVAEVPQFKDNMARVMNREAVDAVIGPVFRRSACAEMIARLDAAQIAWSRVSTLQDLKVHGALSRTSVELPDGTVASMPHPAGRRIEDRRKVPLLGADTESLREEFAGDGLQIPERTNIERKSQ